MTLIATSTANVWFKINETIGGHAYFGPLAAGEEQLILDDIGGQPQIISAPAIRLMDDRSFLDIGGGDWGFGYSVFGHDCIVFGTAGVASRTP